jgi:hypothetical protein
LRIRIDREEDLDDLEPSETFELDVPAADDLTSDNFLTFGEEKTFCYFWRKLMSSVLLKAECG